MEVISAVNIPVTTTYETTEPCNASCIAVWIDLK